MNSNDLSNARLDDILGSMQSEFNQVRVLESRIVSLYMAVRLSTGAYYSNDYKVALAYLSEVEKMFDGMNQQHALGVVYNNKAEVLRSIANSAKGDKKEKFAESLTVFAMAIDNARAILHKTRALLKDEKVGEVLELQERIDEVHRRITSYKAVLSNRLINLSNVYRDTEDYEAALQAASEADEVAQSEDDIIGIIRVSSAFP